MYAQRWDKAQKIRLKGRKPLQAEKLEGIKNTYRRKACGLDNGAMDGDQRSGLLATGCLTSGKSSEIPFPLLPFVYVAPRSF